MRIGLRRTRRQRQILNARLHEVVAHWNQEVSFLNFAYFIDQDIFRLPSKCCNDKTGMHQSAAEGLLHFFPSPKEHIKQ